MFLFSELQKCLLRLRKHKSKIDIDLRYNFDIDIGYNLDNDIGYCVDMEHFSTWSVRSHFGSSCTQPPVRAAIAPSDGDFRRDLHEPSMVKMLPSNAMPSKAARLFSKVNSTAASNG